MRLERLEISGFKSFSDRSELAFDQGVTAIVGPNGCGKSNVADAITWVLGEQSAKSLRGDKMEDVIFNGSDARKPGAAAEVRLRLAGLPLPPTSPVTPVNEIAGLKEFHPPADEGHANGNGHAAEVAPAPSFTVVKTEKFHAQPMSVSDACVQLNLLNEPFLVFRLDGNDGRVAVVYKREDGSYGLIETPTAS